MPCVRFPHVAYVLVLLPAFSGFLPAEAGGGCPYVVHLGHACLQPDGLYRITLPDGHVLLTHGPDPMVPDAAAPVPGTGFDEGDETRQPVCATRDLMHVAYGHPRGRANRADLVIPEIRDHVRRMNALLNAESLHSGGPTADFKVRCDEAGDIQVDVFEGPDTGGGQAYTAEFAGIVAAARGAGLAEVGVDYAIFYDDGSTVCGVGDLAYDDRLSASNENMVGPDYGVSYEACWGSGTPMHENGHNQGAVQQLAPDWDLYAHCLEGHDVMCYPTSAILVFCPDRIHYDCDNDTYFDAAPEQGEWLSTHWNIGSSLNRYIAWDEGPRPATWVDPAAETSANTTEASGNATQTSDPAAPTTTQPSPAPTSETPAPTASAEPTPTRASTTSPAPAPTLQAPRAAAKAPAPGPMASLVLLGMAAWVRRR